MCPCVRLELKSSDTHGCAGLYGSMVPGLVAHGTAENATTRGSSQLFALDLKTSAECAFTLLHSKT